MRDLTASQQSLHAKSAVEGGAAALVVLPKQQVCNFLA